MSFQGQADEWTSDSSTSLKVLLKRGTHGGVGAVQGWLDAESVLALRAATRVIVVEEETICEDTSPAEGTGPPVLLVQRRRIGVLAGVHVPIRPEHPVNFWFP